MRTALLISALLPCLVAADEPAKAKKDPQAKFEPRSEPGLGQKFLEGFVGEWDVQKSFFPRAGEPAKTTGTCRQSFVQGGRFLQSDFVFKQGATTSTGQGLIGFEPETGKFTSVWIDSRQTRMSFRQGTESFDGKAIRLESKTLGPAEGETRRSRTVTTIDPGRTHIVHRQFAIAADGSERLMMELLMTRTATPAAR